MDNISTFMKRLVVTAALLLLVAAGCESVSSENIQRWRNTEKGPGKLEAALKDSSVSPELRAQAAAALVEIGMGGAVDTAVSAMPEAERGPVIAQLVPLYAETIEKGTVTKARDARDGLFGLRDPASPEERARIDRVLLPSIAKDLRSGRAAGGRHSITKILTTIGPGSGPVLLELLDEPASPYPAIVDVLVKVADPPTRERAGASLVKRAGRGPEIPVALWRALGAVGGRAVIEFLKSKVEKGHEKDAVAAAQALQQGTKDPDLTPFALKIAGDTKANKAVRDEMFGLLEYLGGASARDGAIRIVAEDPDELVRYRAYECALSTGKVEAVVPALEAFPLKASYKRDDVMDFLVKDIQKLGTAALPALRNALSSKAVLARMTGVLALEKMGSAADVSLLRSLQGDRATIKGFSPGQTVGKEASRVAGVLAKEVEGSAGRQ
jgi:hypothetical protein